MPSATTTLGTPCAESWNDAWLAFVDETEQRLGRPICGAHAPDGEPCELGSTHPMLVYTVSGPGRMKMTDRSSQVLKDILSLPRAERAELAEHILASLDTPERRKIDQEWAAEAEDRLDAYERGEQPTIAVKEVFEKYRKSKNG